MNGVVTQSTWVEANQRYLRAELARLKLRLGVDGDMPAALKMVDDARAALPAPAAIDVLTNLFGLSAFERDVVLLSAGAEMDSELASCCAAVQGQSQRAFATFGVALAAFEDPHWDAVTPLRPLRRWRLVEVDESGGLTQGRLRIDERILHYLAGVNYLDVRVRSLVRTVPAPSVMAEAHCIVCEAIQDALAQMTADEAPLVVLTGDDALGQADIAAEVATALGLSLQIIRAEDLPAGHAELDALATLWQREAALLGVTVLVTCGDDAFPRTAGRFIEELHSLVFVSAAQPQSFERPALRFTANKPDTIEQKRLWQQALGASAARLNGALDGIASQFRLSARPIHTQGAQLAPALAVSTEPETLLWSACRNMGRSKLDELAQRIDVAAGWDDLVLPEGQKITLRQIGAHVRNRLKVYLEWGFAHKGTRGLGISALFAGESGTGKTMAAEVLAKELQLDLYRIDLSSVVNKYIGETEKNLRRVFDAAEESGAILFFDEADALFGKRSEVKDSHDRYANIEVSYLLQRMEAYRGLAILTTNLKAALDSAFQRRLRFVVQFPFPDQAMRELIWRSTFPPSTPLGRIDYPKLARLSVAGGNIHNIALNAAFDAAEREEPLSMAHLLQAAHHEASKRERPLSDAETRGWV